MLIIVYIYNMSNAQNNKIKLDILFREIESNLIARSQYFDFDGKVVRLANHIAEPFNFVKYNEDAKEILLIFVGDISEITAEKNSDRVADYLDVECDWIVCDDLEHTAYYKHFINQFLN